MKKLLTLIGVILLIGCDANHLMGPPVSAELVEAKMSETMSLQAMPDYLWKFVNDVSKTLPVTAKSRSTVPRIIESVIPVTELNDTLMWIVNYSNRQGYLVLSTDRNSFPILACYDEGCFDSNSMTNPWIEEKKDLIKSKRKSQYSKSKSIYSDLWDKIITHKSDVEISYELIVGDDAVSKQNGYFSVHPILLTQWGNGWGYHYEMPVVKDILFGTHKAEVPDFVVTLGQYLHHYRLPFREGLPTFDYNKMMLSYGKMEPYLDEPNEIASMLRFICDHLKFGVVSSSIYIPPRQVADVVYMLWDFGFPKGTRLAYWWDRNGEESYQHVFDDIYDCLKRGYPIIGGVVYKNKEGFSVVDWTENDKIAYTFIIDGLQDVSIRVTEKSVLGTKSYAYQSFQVRYLRPANGNFSTTGPDIRGGDTTGWYDLDYIDWIWGVKSRYYVYTACVTRN